MHKTKMDKTKIHKTKIHKVYLICLMIPKIMFYMNNDEISVRLIDLWILTAYQSVSTLNGTIYQPLRSGRI